MSKRKFIKQNNDNAASKIARWLDENKENIEPGVYTKEVLSQLYANFNGQVKQLSDQTPIIGEDDCN